MFGKLGDMAGMLQQAKKMQENLKQAQQEIAEMEISGQSDDGLVEILMGGDMLIKQIFINPECISLNNPEAVAEIVREAVNKTISQVKARAQEKMQEVTGGLDLPGLT